MKAHAHVAAAVLLAFDDTDSPEGGCTTSLVFPVLAALPDAVLRSMPRLVRLDPNVPHKTRGNGAVVLDLGRPNGPRTVVGEDRRGPVHACPDAAPARLTDDEVEAAWQAIQAAAEPGSEPGMVAVDDVPAAVYWQAVQTRVEPDAVEALAAGHVRGGRGTVGALAAAAWPGPASSSELIAYRAPEQIGRPRDVDGDRLMQLDVDACTFHSGDTDEGVPACIPHTPCPVLAGLRGLDPERLVDEALPVLREASREPVAAWLVFATNQASGDHVMEVDQVGAVPAWATIAVDTTVMEDPKELRGGHVMVRLVDRIGHPIEAMAFEPTKSFRQVVRSLRAGDHIHAVGAWDDGTMRLEKLRIDDMAEPLIKTGNPECPQCGRRMKSRGKDAGYRCPFGHGDAPEDAATTQIEQRKVRPGWYEVPVMARRHLHRPLAFDVIPR